MAAPMTPNRLLTSFDGDELQSPCRPRGTASTPGATAASPRPRQAPPGLAALPVPEDSVVPEEPVAVLAMGPQTPLQRRTAAAATALNSPRQRDAAKPAASPAPALRYRHSDTGTTRNSAVRQSTEGLPGVKGRRGRASHNGEASDDGLAAGALLSQWIAALPSAVAAPDNDCVRFAARLQRSSTVERGPGATTSMLRCAQSQAQPSPHAWPRALCHGPHSPCARPSARGSASRVSCIVCRVSCVASLSLLACHPSRDVPRSPPMSTQTDALWGRVLSEAQLAPLERETSVSTSTTTTSTARSSMTLATAAAADRSHRSVGRRDGDLAAHAASPSPRPQAPRVSLSGALPALDPSPGPSLAAAAAAAAGFPSPFLAAQPQPPLNRSVSGGHEAFAAEDTPLRLPALPSFGSQPPVRFVSAVVPRCAARPCPPHPYPPHAGRRLAHTPWRGQRSPSSRSFPLPRSP
jgi:hypothetical protein